MPYVPLEVVTNGELTKPLKWRSQWKSLGQTDKTSKQPSEWKTPQIPTDIFDISDFTFVNVSSPKDTIGDGYKTAVRGHITRQRRRHETVNVEALGVSLLRKKCYEHVNSGLALTMSCSNDNGIIYPVQMSRELYMLIEYMHSSVFDEISAFRHVWFAMILSDEASFWQHASTTLTHYKKMVESRPAESIEARELHLKAIRSVKMRLCNATQKSITDGLVASVLCFLTFSHIIKDKEAYKLHRTGFNRMISVRGGIETLHGNENLMLMILWDEVCGGCAFDIKPTYPLPEIFLTPLTKRTPPVKPSRRLIRSLQSWRKRFPAHATFVEIIEDLHVLIECIREGGPKIWRDSSLLGMHVNPIMHRLLALSDHAACYSLDTNTMEALRLALILLLGEVRQKLMFYHFVGDHIKEKLALLLVRPLDWSMLDDLELWVLMIAGMNMLSPDKEPVLGAISTALKMRSIKTFEEAMVTISNMLWIEGMFPDGRRTLKRYLLLCT